MLFAEDIVLRYKGIVNSMLQSGCLVIDAVLCGLYQPLTDTPAPIILKYKCSYESTTPEHYILCRENFEELLADAMLASTNTTTQRPSLNDMESRAQVIVPLFTFDTRKMCSCHCIGTWIVCSRNELSIAFAGMLMDTYFTTPTSYPYLSHFDCSLAPMPLI